MLRLLQSFFTLPLFYFLNFLGKLIKFFLFEEFVIPSQIPKNKFCVKIISGYEKLRKKQVHILNIKPTDRRPRWNDSTQKNTQHCTTLHWCPATCRRERARVYNIKTVNISKLCRAYNAMYTTRLTSIIAS